MKYSDAQCDYLFAKTNLDVKRWVITILSELDRAEDKHPVWPKDDFVHAAAIVGEESGELIRAALQHHYEKGRYYEMHKEAIQVAAMALRFLKNAPDKRWENP